MSINLTDEIEVKTKKGKLGAAKQIFLEGDMQTVENEIQNINSRHNTLNNKHESLSKTVQGIAATGGASTANNVTYNNDNSGLNAENAQDAIDELAAKNKAQDATIGTKADKSEVDAELDKKFDKSNIAQELGDAEDKVMSQKSVSTKLSDLGIKIGEIVSYGEYTKGTLLPNILQYKGEKVRYSVSPINDTGAISFYDEKDTFITYFINEGEKIVPANAAKVIVDYGDVRARVYNLSLSNTILSEDIKRLEDETNNLKTIIIGKQEIVNSSFDFDGTIINRGSVGTTYDVDIKSGDNVSFRVDANLLTGVIIYVSSDNGVNWVTIPFPTDETACLNKVYEFVANTNINKISLYIPSAYQSGSGSATFVITKYDINGGLLDKVKLAEQDIKNLKQEVSGLDILQELLPSLVTTNAATGTSANNILNPYNGYSLAHFVCVKDRNYSIKLWTPLSKQYFEVLSYSENLDVTGGSVVENIGIDYIGNADNILNIKAAKSGYIVVCYPTNRYVPIVTESYSQSGLVDRVDVLEEKMPTIETTLNKLTDGYTPEPIDIYRISTAVKAMGVNTTTKICTFVDGTGYKVACDYFEVEYGKKYSVHIPKTPQSKEPYFTVLGYVDSLEDEQGTWIQATWDISSVLDVDVVAERSGYLVVCYSTNNSAAPSVLFKAYRVPSINEQIEKLASILKGKKIAYNGDSICESRLSAMTNGYNGGAYAKLIADIVGGTYENRAISGGILASKVPDGDTQSAPPRFVVSDVENMAEDADLVCFEGGVNDFWHKVPLGVVRDFPDDLKPYDGNYDTTTLLGALEMIFYKATQRWVGKPIVFIITHKITTTLVPGSGYEYTYYDVVEGMKKACKKWSIPFYNAFEESGFNAYNPIQKSMFTYNQDGCHPNKEGYMAYYVPQLIKLFESIMPYE